MPILKINDQATYKHQYQTPYSGAEPGDAKRQEIQAQQNAEKRETIKEPASSGSPQNYTIQLASCRTKVSAQKEAELLRKSGFSPLILSKGSYIVVCVGNFSNQQAAKTLVSELKKRKRYQDCLVRRL